MSAIKKSSGNEVGKKLFREKDTLGLKKRIEHPVSVDPNASIKDVTIDAYMTRNPATVGQRQMMDSAHRIMRENNIRHLPVVDGERLVGLVTDGDLHLLESLDDVDPKRVSVNEAMTHEPYRVTADTPLQRVVTEMARKKYSSALVVDGEKVIGIFTAVDMARLCVDMLSERR